MTAIIKNDYDAFCKLKSKYATVLSADDISDIWKYVHDSSMGLPLESKYSIACTKLDELSGASVTIVAEDKCHHKIDPEFETFVILCEELYHISVLEQIWMSIDSEYVGEDRFDTAVMLAMERSSEDASSIIESVEITNPVTIAQPPSVLPLPMFDKNKKQRRKEKRNKIMSSQQAVLDMLEETFRGTEVSTQMIRDIASDHNYDPEECIENIWKEHYRLHSLVREGVTFADTVVVSGKENRGVINDSLQINAKITTNNSELRIKGTDRQGVLSSALSTSICQTGAYHRFAEHFLWVARKNNPELIINLSRNGILSYEGSLRSSNISEFDQDIRVDLHGLTVLRGLELVESAINYFYQLSPISRSGKSIPNKKYRIKFVVGRGAHSSGGIAKLKPAVERYLLRNDENDFIVYDGEIHLSIIKSRNM